MSNTELTVETIPASVPVEEHEAGRRIDFSFGIHNGSADAFELVAIEESVCTAGGSLVQLRLVNETGSPIPAGAEQGSRIGAGEQRTIRNPLPEFAPGTPLDLLVYRLVFRGSDGHLLPVTVRLSPVASRSPSPSAESTETPPAPTQPAPPAEKARPAPPTPRQLTRSWFETLYELGVFAAA